MKRIFETEENVYSAHYKKEFPSLLLVAGDVHFHQNARKEIFKSLVDVIRKRNPDFVVLPGDFVDTISFIDYIKEREFFEKMIRDIAEVAPLILVPGNHEIGYFGQDNSMEFLARKQGKENIKSIKYLESLNRFKNVYFLNNVKTSINDMCFIGFSPRIATYLKRNERVQDMLIEDYIKSGLSMKDENFNILVTHSPILLHEENVMKALSDFALRTDLAITGHLHDGYMPKSLDNVFGETNYGIFFTPFIPPIPGTKCRGLHEFGRGKLFISQGFKKWSGSKIYILLDRVSSYDMEKLIIDKPDERFGEDLPKQKLLKKKQGNK